MKTFLRVASSTDTSLRGSNESKYNSSLNEGQVSSLGEVGDPTAYSRRASHPFEGWSLDFLFIVH